MLKKIYHRYRTLWVVIWFVLVFKFIMTLFYGSYFFYFNNLAPKWDHMMQSQFGLDLFFLKLEPYRDFSFFLSSFQSPTTYFGVIVFVFLFWYRKRISWEALEVNGFLRLIFIVPAFLLCWELLTYDYNYYLDQYFLLERILMLLFLGLVWYHPMYSVWFLLTALLFRGQFDFPIGGFPLYDKKLLFDIYVLLISFLVIRTQLKLSKKWLPYFLLILVASGYFAAGLGKLRYFLYGYRWLLQDPLQNLVLNGVERGWSLPGFWLKWVAEYTVFCKLAVLTVELISLSLLYKKKWAVFLLSCFTAMHLVIFYISGIFFWKWIGINAVLIGYLIFEKNTAEIFNRKKFMCSLLIIPFAIFWENAYPIGWLDTKYNQMFRYTVVLENGQEYHVSQSLFDPFHQLFYRGKFLYLVDDKTIKITEFGYTFRYELAQAVNQSTLGTIDQVKESLGANHFDLKQNKKYTAFIKTFFHNYNERLNENDWRKYFRAPEHIYIEVPKPRYKGNGKIKKLNIYLKTTYIEENEVILLEKSLVKSITIP